MKLSWHLIPDGSSTIVEFEITGEFTVSSMEAAAQAREGMIPIIARISGENESAVRGLLEQVELAELFLADGPRPEEPSV